MRHTLTRLSRTTTRASAARFTGVVVGCCCFFCVAPSASPFLPLLVGDVGTEARVDDPDSGVPGGLGGWGAGWGEVGEPAPAGTGGRRRSGVAPASRTGSGRGGAGVARVETRDSHTRSTPLTHTLGSGTEQQKDTAGLQDRLLSQNSVELPAILAQQPQRSPASEPRVGQTGRKECADHRTTRTSSNAARKDAEGPVIGQETQSGRSAEPPAREAREQKRPHPPVFAPPTFNPIVYDEYVNVTVFMQAGELLFTIAAPASSSPAVGAALEAEAVRRGGETHRRWR